MKWQNHNVPFYIPQAKEDEYCYTGCWSFSNLDAYLDRVECALNDADLWSRGVHRDRQCKARLWRMWNGADDHAEFRCGDRQDHGYIPEYSWNSKEFAGLCLRESRTCAQDKNKKLIGVIEGISLDWIAAFGTAFDIDPSFFADHIRRRYPSESQATVPEASLDSPVEKRHVLCEGVIRYWERRKICNSNICHQLNRRSPLERPKLEETCISYINVTEKFCMFPTLYRLRAKLTISPHTRLQD